MKKLIRILLCAGCSLLLAPCSLLFGQVAPKKTSALQGDADANGRTNPGDTLRYTITITNTSGTNLLNVQFNDSNSPNQTLVGGSIKSTPIARPDAYTGIIGNTPFVVPATSGVLANDSDPDGDSISVVAFSATSVHGGTVIMTNNGGFYFLPPVGYQGTDTFAYTISDGNGGSNTATVTLTISNMVWYVDNAFPNGDGRQTSPFSSLTPLNGALGSGDPDGPNDYIYVARTANTITYTTGIFLENGQKLIGSGVALVVNGTSIYPAGSRPQISVASGTALIVASNATAQGLNVTTLAGRALTGTNVGTLTVDAMILNAAGGTAVDLHVGNLAVTLDSLTCSSSPAHGIQLNNVGGSFTVSSGSSVANTGGAAVRIVGGTVNVSFPGLLSKSSAGQIVDIQGRTGGSVTLAGNITASNSSSGILVQNCTGGTITFSGTNKSLSTGANPAVNLANNSGTTINLTNGVLAITTTSGTGFNATGGGTVNVTGTSNTISSSSGTAVNIVNTLVGASGVTFQSVSSTGGTTPGIVLTGTGNSGVFTVTGDGGGSNNGSGGTISNKTGASETTGTPGVRLNNVANVRLKYMNISGNNHSGIYGTTVNGFQLDRCNITGNGNTTTSNPDELGVDLYELTGSATNGPNPTSINNTTISNNWEFELHVVNTTGTLTDFQVNNCRISSDGANAVHGDLVSFLGQGSSNMKLNVSGGSFVGAAPATADAIFGNAGGASMTVIVSGAAFTNNNVGVNVSTDPVNTTLTFNITNNTFTGGRAQAINQFNNGNPPFARTVNGRIQNNTIGTLGVAGSGSSVGRGIDVGNEGSVNVNILISGNTIQEVTSFEGIGVNVGVAGLATGGGTNNLTITGNTIRNINGSRGLIVQDNQDTTSGGPFPTLFANISGNSFSGIAGQAGNGQFMRLRRLNGTVKVTQAAATAAAIAAELDDANGFSDPTKISVSGTITFSAGTPPTPP